MLENAKFYFEQIMIETLTALEAQLKIHLNTYVIADPGTVSKIEKVMKKNLDHFIDIVNEEKLLLDKEKSYKPSEKAFFEDMSNPCKVMMLKSAIEIKKVDGKFRFKS